MNAENAKRAKDAKGEVVDENDPSYAFIGAIIEVLRELGPGLPKTVHEAQLLDYLKLTGLKLGILVNFNVSEAKDGIYRRALKL